jgi:hypothetical protein
MGREALDIIKFIFHSPNGPGFLVWPVSPSRGTAYNLPSPHPSSVSAIASSSYCCFVFASSPTFCFDQGQIGPICRSRPRLLASATSGIAAWAATKAYQLVPMSFGVRFQTTDSLFWMTLQPTRVTPPIIRDVLLWDLYFIPDERMQVDSLCLTS